MTNVVIENKASDLSEEQGDASEHIFEANLAAMKTNEQKKQGHLGQLSPSSLAYLGDAVYELYVRTQFLLPPKRTNLTV